MMRFGKWAYGLGAAAMLSMAISPIGAAAASVGSVLAKGGIQVSLSQQGATLESLRADKGAQQLKIESILSKVEYDKVQQDKAAKEAQAKEAQERAMLENLVIAQVNDYVNVRSLPSEEGEILGKLYNKSVGTLVSQQDGWYEITSGSVTGFVKAEYCVTGEAAVELAKEVATRIATVTTTTLKVRKEASLEAEVLGLVPIEDQLVVSQEIEGWVEVDVEEGLGWVSTDYVELRWEFVTAESKAEEEARLAKEAAARAAARAAAAAKAAKSARASSGSTGSGQSQPAAASGGDGTMGRAVADYALQFVGNPYVYGGTSLTNGADCSGFVMSVYANFGVSLPHSSSADRSQGSAVDGLANAQPGDLVCYSGHVGLYIGDNQIVHASTSKTGIIVSRADYKKVLAVRRIF